MSSNINDERINKSIDRNTEINSIADAIKEQFILHQNKNIELRVIYPKTKNGDGKNSIKINHFSRDNLDALFLEAARYDIEGKAIAVWTSLQDCEFNGKGNHNAIDDNDIIYYTHFPIDIDAERKDDKHTSATDDEKRHAKIVAENCIEFFRKRYGHVPHYADSGNGMQLVFEINAENDKEGENKRIIELALKRLAELHDQEGAAIDTGNFNPSRMWKLYGTVTRKGKETTERPWRRSKVLKKSDSPFLPFSILEGLAAEYEQSHPQMQAAEGGEPGTRVSSREKIHIENAKEWIETHFEVTDKPKGGKHGGMIYNVQTCPMNPAHDNGESFFHVSNDNRVSFYCPHYATSHCNENQISDVIQKYDSELWEDVEAISREANAIEECANWLIRTEGGFIRHYLDFMDDYHAGDMDSKTLLFRGNHRAHFHSTAALIHYELTGASRSGKTDLVTKFALLLPEQYALTFTSTSEQAWWYLLFEKEEYVAKDGKVKTRLVPNKHFFEETTTFLLEMADSGVTALKQFAEEYEHTELTRLTVKDQEPLKISVTGPRSFVAASVGGAPSDDGMQVANRFIQMPIDEKTTKHEKVALMTDNFLIGRDIQRDMRVKIIKRAFELLYKDGLNVVVRPPNEEVQKLIRELGIKLVKAVIITQVSQFHALCQCGAFENRFARDDPGICEITVKDVLEAWYLFNSFEKSITSKLTTAEYNILKAIEQISYTYTTVASTLDGGTTEEVIKQGTRGLAQNEIAKKANVGIASVSRALKCKAAPYGKMLEAGFVTYEYNRHVRATVFSRTADGDAILNGNLGLSVEIDEQKYETLSIIPSIPNNSKGLWNYENGKLLIKDDSNEYVDIYIYKFHNSINNREGLGGIESDNEIDSENISHHENIPLPLEKVELWNSENESVKTTSESETNTVPPPEEFHTLLESNGILLPKVESEENHIKSKKYNLFDDYNIRFAALRQIIAHHHDELDNSDYDAMVTSAYNLILWNSKDFIDGDSLEDRILNDDLLSDIKNVIADIVSGGG